MGKSRTMRVAEPVVDVDWAEGIDDLLCSRRPIDEPAVKDENGYEMYTR